ncbi:MAG TPA: MFS transporter [Thermomicrobiales bacterium]|nr:MFS transporter [Thermomicrobiales bacterium]
MFQSLHMYPAYRKLWLGTLATNTGFWMYQIAIGWLALVLTDSALFVGLTGFAGGIPILFLAIPSGILIDRIDRRTVLLVAQLGVMLVSGIFALLVWTDQIERWSVLLLAFATGSVMSFIFPTRNAIVPALVDRHHLANAVALNAAGQNATRVVGPAVAGAMIAVVGIAGTFALAAALQIVAMLWTAQLPKRASQAQARAGTLWTNLTLGLRVIAGDRFLTGLILLATVTTVLIMPYINLMPVFARDVLGTGEVGLGLLMGVTGLGSVTGALLVARSQRLATRPGIQLTTALGFAALVFVFALVPVLAVAAGLLFIAGLISAAFMAINQTVLQLKVEDEVRGRVLSIYLLTWGMLPLGQLPIGALAQRVGAPIATALACAIAAALIALIALRNSPLRQQ